MKQGTTRRPTSHLVHLYTVPFLWTRDEHRRQEGLVDDFIGHVGCGNSWVAQH